MSARHARTTDDGRRTRGARPSSVVRRLSLATLFVASAAGAQAAPDAPSFRVQYGVRVTPDTVTVGDPIRVVVRVRAPVGAEIAFPADPDTTGPLQPREPRVVRTAPDTAALDQSATYTLAAWDVDSQVVALGPVVVRLEGEERRVALPPVRVFVRSVLPADSAQRVPKPPRDLIEPRAWPWWWLALLLAALAVGGALYWWWRRRRRGAPAAAEDAYERARREFARVEALRLPDSGEPGRHVALAVDVLRDYLAARLPAASRAHTTAELVSALRGTRAVARDRLARLLSEADLVKFARSPVSRDHAYEMGREAAAIVDEVQARLVAEEQAAREAAEREAKAASTRRAA